jgi:putative FmdB family regulatory protein
MPIYEYRCRECSKVFELLIRASAEESDDSGPHCPQCGSGTPKRLFSLFASRSDGPVKVASGGGGGGGCCGGGCGCH